MSRVDEERDAARVQQRLAEAKRTEQAKRTAQANEAHTFSKLVGQQQAAQVTTKQQQATKQETAAKSAIAQLLHEAEEAVTTKHDGERAQLAQHEQGRLGAQSQEQSVSTNKREAGHLSANAKAGTAKDEALAAQGRATDSSVASQTTEGRKADAKMVREVLEDRKSSSDEHSENQSGASGGKARGEKGDLKTNADKGGGQGQGGNKDGKDGQGAPPTMRFNPALMPPVAVAKPKDLAGSERLRRVANELAQKIVERVRVGTNAAGRVEFQIDLRSDVLSGLSVKVSSQNGKIKAVFSGTNKDVLKLVEEQGEALKGALAARGLSLEDFKVERRT